VRKFKALENPVIAVLLIGLIAVVASALIRLAMKSPGRAVIEQLQKPDSAQDKQFRSMVDAGREFYQDGRYASALEQYAQAEKAVPRLNENQYTALKNARQQIAEAYENAGRQSDAEALYKDMIESAFHDAAAQLKAGDAEAAVERYQDNEQLAAHLSDAQKIYRIRLTQGEIVSLRRINRFPEAIQASQHLIDYLQAGNQDDPQVVEAYMRMGETYQLQRDWQHLEETLVASQAICDRILQENSSVPYNQEPVWSTITSEDQILYALMDDYSQQGKPQQALDTAQTLYDFIDKYSTQWMELAPHGRKAVARYAMVIAARANRPGDADAWRAKMKESR
jgi:tetratricopeptide (TPR) repeat protein